MADILTPEQVTQIRIRYIGTSDLADSHEALRDERDALKLQLSVRQAPPNQAPRIKEGRTIRCRTCGHLYTPGPLGPPRMR